MIRKILINTFICGVIVVVGLAIAFTGVRLRASDHGAEAAIAEQRKPSVIVEVLQPGTVEDRLMLTGSLIPWRDVTLSAETMGRIEWQGVEEGDTVNANDELIRVDTHTIEVQLEQARAQFQLAKAELERSREMSAQGIGSSQEYDRAAVDHDVAQATLRAREIELENSIVRATFDGIVDRLYEEAGEFVTAGKELVRLVQTDKVKLVVGIPERDIPYCEPGDDVAVVLDAYPGEEFNGKIYRIATTAEETTHTFATEIELDNGHGRLKPGMIARAHLVRQVFEDAIVVPIFSVITAQSSQHVFVEVDGVALKRPVETGLIQGKTVQITSGLAPGDRLIVVGQRELRDGDPVNVREAHP